MYPFSTTTISAKRAGRVRVLSAHSPCLALLNSFTPRSHAAHITLVGNKPRSSSTKGFGGHTDLLTHAFDLNSRMTGALQRVASSRHSQRSDFRGYGTFEDPEQNEDCWNRRLSSIRIVSSVRLRTPRWLGKKDHVALVARAVSPYNFEKFRTVVLTTLCVYGNVRIATFGNHRYSIPVNIKFYRVQSQSGEVNCYDFETSSRHSLSP